MARALVVAACLVLGHSRGASAGGPIGKTIKTSKVTIETDPPGAKIYFGLKEDGEVCTTPCTVDAPVGETAIIVEAENRRSIIDTLVVKKTARPQRLSYHLEPAVGTLIIDGGAGATITIDEQDEGKAPKRIEDVVAGPHHVVLKKNGKKLYDGNVEIEVGQEATVSPPPGAELAAARADDRPSVTVSAPAPGPRPSPRPPSFSVGAMMDAGFRRFDYHNRGANPADIASQRDDRERGQLLAGPIVELWPTTLLGLGVLPGLALYGRLELGLNPQAVQVTDTITGQTMTTSLRTAWRSLEVSVHQRWTIAGTGTVEVGAGYTDDRYQFTSNNADEIAMVPDADYQSVRIGGRGSLLFDALEPYVAVENRIVLHGGAMEHRYTGGTSVNGVKGALGAAAHLGAFEARIEGALTLYSWAFRPNPGDPKADGGSDFIQNVTFTVGYTY